MASSQTILGGVFVRMRILVVGNVDSNITGAYSWFVKNVYEGCTALGHQVAGVDFKTLPTHKIREVIWSFKPHIIFTHLTFHKHGLVRLDEVMTMYAEARKQLGAKVIHYMFDARREPRYSRNISEAFDCAFVSNLEAARKFPKIWGIPVHYSQYACRMYKEMAQPAKDIQVGDTLVFTGSPGSYPGQRQTLLKGLKKLVPMTTFVTGSPQDLRFRSHELSATAKGILSVSFGYDVEGFIDTRPWQYLGSGAFLILKVFDGMEDVLPAGLYKPFYTFDPYEVKIIWEEWFAKDTLPMRQNAFQFMQQYHACDKRMADTLDVIFEKRNSVRIFLGDLE